MAKGDLAGLFGGQAAEPIPPELDQAMSSINTRIADLLSRSQRGPSVGDVGRSILMSAAYRGQVPHTKFLQDQQNQEYQGLGNQIELLNSGLQMRLQQAQAKAGSNPMADFLVKDLGKLADENPRHANALYEAIENDPQPFTVEGYMRHKATTAPRGIPKVVDIPFTDESGVEHVQHEVYDDYGNQQNVTRTLKKSPETNVSVYNDLTPEAAGKTTGAALGKRLVQEVRQSLFPEGREGPVDRGKLYTGGAAASGLPGAKMAFGWTEGARARDKSTFAARQFLRITSGAVIGVEEVEQEYPLVIPGAFDSEQSVRDKLDRMEVWFDVTEQLMKGGMQADEAVKVAYDRVTSAVGSPATATTGPEAGTVEDGYKFKGGDPSDPNNWEKVE